MAKSNHDWAKIKVEFIKSTLSIRDFAEAFNIPLGTLSRKVTKEKWTDERSQVDHKVITKSIEKTIEDRVDELTQFENKNLKAIAYAQDEVLKMLSICEKPNEIKSLTGALLDLQKGYRLALGASTENQATQDVSDFTEWIKELNNEKGTD
ncbi:hypothetical protein [Rodentibacter pneumotropicus]|uniref:Uncharacterized protein n=1 Tax=Rodentibacter pneumotropicus TaxID=758 RepID=A0A4S2Q4B2_9PAST|nr:hypothetical protein [Rodentibacter pneumotropicus]MDC2824589.1 hypothetical protein [Rodentibacter pneumotropicus]THA11319.1 hypothetical protein D3M78_00445 [Rodentibacter pneumotropicus]THA17980.1 hypothetical protein D3M76_00295 [Rodentibacter pneumotropicus]